jgi:predicted ATP-dependent endonuclease of OLD family
VHLSRFTISNHKCFNSTAELILRPGVNLIVGKNNSGKSTLLEALSMSSQPVPHRNFSEGREVLGTGIPASASFRFTLKATELSKIAVGNSRAFVAVPLPDPKSALAI